MADASILQRCADAAKGHEAEHGTGARCLHHDVVDELKRLYAIERDVRALLIYGAEATTGTHQRRYYDHLKQEYATLEEIASRRVEAGKRLLLAVGR